VNEGGLRDIFQAVGLDSGELSRVFTHAELVELVHEGPVEDLLRRTAVRLLRRIEELQGDEPLHEELALHLDEASYARLRSLYTEEQIRRLMQAGSNDGVSASGAGTRMDSSGRLSRVFRRSRMGR
jgi:hypothetical protein